MTAKKSLQAIGFSENEARTYLALLADYPATGYQISKSAGIPRSMIYEILAQLNARGAVMESSEGRATLYRPIDPAILLNEHQQTYFENLTHLRSELKKIYVSRQDLRVWALTDLEAIYSYARQMITQATDEVYLMTNDTHVEKLSRAAKTSSQAGVSIHLLSTGSRSLSFAKTAYHPPLESELQGIADTLVVLIDQKEVMIAQTSVIPSATITNNPNLVLISRQFIWMEFFTQRIYAQIGKDLLTRLDPADQEIFLSLTHSKNKKDAR